MRAGVGTMPSSESAVAEDATSRKTQGRAIRQRTKECMCADGSSEDDEMRDLERRWEMGDGGDGGDEEGGDRRR